MKQILIHILLLVFPLISFAQVSESFGGRFIVTSQSSPLPASDKFRVVGIFKHPRANYTADSIQVGDIFVDCNCNYFTVDSIYSAISNLADIRVMPADTTVNLIPSCTGGIIRINSPPNGTYAFPANIPLEIMDCFLNYNFQALSGLDTAYLANDTLYLVTPSDTIEIYIPTPYLNTLADVDTTSLQVDDLLKWNGTNWIVQSSNGFGGIYGGSGTVPDSTYAQMADNAAALDTYDGFALGYFPDFPFRSYLNKESGIFYSPKQEMLHVLLGDSTEQRQTGLELYDRNLLLFAGTSYNYGEIGVSGTQLDMSAAGDLAGIRVLGSYNGNYGSYLGAMKNNARNFAGLAWAAPGATTYNKMVSLPKDSTLHFIVQRKNLNTYANTFNWLDINMEDTTSNSIEFYDKYFFTNSSPSTTLSEKSLMTWTGTGSTATPAFETAADVVSAGGGGYWTPVSANTLYTSYDTITGGPYFDSIGQRSYIVPSAYYSPILEWPAIDFILGDTLQGRFRAIRADIAGTRDVFFELTSDTDSGYGYLEAWRSAGLILGTGGSTGIGEDKPIIFKPDRTERLKLNSDGLLIFTPTSANPAGTAGGQYYDSDNSTMWYHDGTAYRAVVKGDAGSWASGRVPFSDGSRLITNSYFTFDNASAELRVGTSVTDYGAYALQVRGGSYFYDDITLRSSSGIDGSAVSRGGVSLIPFKFYNASSDNAAVDARGYVAAIYAAVLGQGSGYSAITTAVNLGSNGALISSTTPAINITSKRILTSAQVNDSRVASNVGLPIDWKYRHDGSELVSTVSRIMPVRRTSGFNTNLEFYTQKDSSLVETMDLFHSGIVFNFYGDGTITGVPTIQGLSVQSNGKIIEREFAYGEMGEGGTPDTVAVVTAGTWSQFRNFEPGDTSNVLVSAGTMYYQGSETAMFLVTLSASVSTDNAGSEVGLCVYKNGVKVAQSEGYEEVSTVGKYSNISTTFLIQLSYNDYLDVYGTTDTNSSNIFAKKANLVMTKQ